MPKTEAPKTPEQNEKPQKPSPETRVKRNEEGQSRLAKALNKITQRDGKKHEKIDKITEKAKEKENQKPIEE